MAAVAELKEIIRRWKKQGKTVLLITHDLELIDACCSYILHLEQRKVREAYPLRAGTEQKLRKFFLEHQYACF